MEIQLAERGLLDRLRAHLGAGDCRRRSSQQNQMKRKPTIASEGNCYASSEALYHILGGKRAGWKAMRLNTGEKFCHWFLKHKSGVILDPSVRQYKRKPDYSKAVGTGFLTKKPSQAARRMIQILTWQ